MNAFELCLNATVLSLETLLAKGFTEALVIEQMARNYFEQCSQEEQERMPEAIESRLKAKQIWVSPLLMSEKRLIRARGNY